MNKRNIHHLHVIKQDTKEGISMRQEVTKHVPKDWATEKLIHSIIREYGEYDDGSYSLDIRILSLSDKRLLLSHYVDADEYEWAMESPTKTETLFKENLPFMQQQVDEELFTVYRENMEEMGMCLNRHSDNGEVYWTRR